jgi:MFS family permease
MNGNLRTNLKFNYLVNMLDGSFFGFAIGFASFSTIIPLFVSTMTDSAVLIGLIPAIHTVGWQLPQLLTARHVSRLKVYKPSVLTFTLFERLPFLGLAIIAWFLPVIGREVGLSLTFLMLIIQGLGAGLTANPWQNMIACIIPPDYLATFFGLQSAASNLLASLGAVLSGYLIDRLPSPNDYSLVFFLAICCMTLSWIFLSLTRETIRETPFNEIGISQKYWKNIPPMLKQNPEFSWFLLARMLGQIGMMGFAFYTIYAVRVLHVSASTVGIMTSVLFVTQVISNPLLGRLADRFNRRIILEFGAICSLISSILAIVFHSASSFFLVLVFSGIANTAYWTIGMTMSMEFGTEVERPLYIGLSNSLVAPFTILAPLLGGWLTDSMGFHLTFSMTAVAALITAIVLKFLVKENGKRINSIVLDEYM